MKLKTDKFTYITAAIIIAAICIFTMIFALGAGTQRTAAAESTTEKAIVFQETNNLATNNGKASSWHAEIDVDFDEYIYEFYCVRNVAEIGLISDVNPASRINLYIGVNYIWMQGDNGDLFYIRNFRFGSGNNLYIYIAEDSVRFYSPQGQDMSFNNTSAEYEACRMFFLENEIQRHSGGYTVQETLTLYKNRAVVALPEPPEKEGYTFVGWYYDAEFTRPYNGEAIYEDTELYAKYEVIMFTVTFDSAGGTEIASLTVQWGGNFARVQPTKEGYTFAGWYKSDGTQYSGQPIYEDMTLTAHWEINKINSEFYVDGELYTSKEIDYGSTFNPAYEREVLLDEQNNLMSTTSSSKAHEWFEGKKYDSFEYQIVFLEIMTLGKSDSEYGLILQLQFVNNVIELRDFSNHGDEIILSIPCPMVIGNITITDQYLRLWYGDTQDYPVGSFEYETLKEFFFGSAFQNLTGASGESIEYLKLYANHSVAEFPEAPEKEGYTFVGWCLDEELTQLYQSEYFYEDVTLYAKFEIITYEVTFDVAGGSPVSNVTVEWGSAVELPITERVGFNFLGWYLPDDTQYLEQPIKEDTLLTARWEVKKFVVTFYVDDEVYTTKEVEYGTTFAAIAEEAKNENLRVVSVITEDGEQPLAAMAGVEITESYSVTATSMTTGEKVSHFISKNPWVFLPVGAGLALVAAVCMAVVKRRG